MPIKKTRTKVRVDRRKPVGPAECDTTVNPDTIWKEYAPKKVRLNTQCLPAESELAYPSILIEGDAISLQCFARVILAVVADEDCGYGISPKGPGAAFFSKAAKFGIYIHRLPCINKEQLRETGKSGGKGDRRAIP
jgi:hypothetical protein